MKTAITVEEAIRLMTDEAERRGENTEDVGGNIRAIVTDHGLGFNAWFCVCCELADRQARREGYTGQTDRAITSAKAKLASARSECD